MRYQHVILGGTGHIGSALAKNLIDRGESVLVVGHDPEKAGDWTNRGAGFETADILDSERLHQVFSLGERLFILNPPAPVSSDTVAEETKQVQAILKGLEGVALQKIVAASTYGAQAGNRIGDLGVLYQLEQGLAKLSVPVAVIRSAYYMSNWAAASESVRRSGTLPTLYPADFKLPMVAPEDIGKYATELMTDDTTGLHFIEGPAHYSPDDVAAAFSKALNKPVTVASTPESKWQEALKKTGFSEPAAQSMANMTRLVLEDSHEVPDPKHGSTTLEEYINNTGRINQ